MNKTTQEQQTAGHIAVAFDYQFYYFMFLLLELRTGEKIGFEVKDDIHIEKADGTTILFQAKHTIDNKTNLTTLDADIWKTISNWCSIIKSEKSNPEFLKKHSFVLFTNKGLYKNDFINSFNQYKRDGDSSKIFDKITELESKTIDPSIKKYFKIINSLGRRKLVKFFQKLIIETDVDDLIEKIKNRLLELYKYRHIADAIYNNLHSELQDKKYLEIKERGSFKITNEDFDKRFKTCFNVASEPKSLPVRDINVLLPEDLENQIFIKQLYDIGDIQNSSEVKLYTTQMLKFINILDVWTNQEFILSQSDFKKFKHDNIVLYNNKFKSIYRNITRQINSGKRIQDLENEIIKLGIDLIDFIRERDLTIPGYLPLGIELSNGHHYALSNNLEIGWHFDWKNKYQIE